MEEFKLTSWWFNVLPTVSTDTLNSFWFHFYIPVIVIWSLLALVTTVPIDFALLVISEIKSGYKQRGQ